MASQHGFLYRLFTWFGAWSSSASPEQRISMGRRIGRVMMWVDPKRRAVTVENVRAAFPNLTPQQQREIVCGSYQNMGITLAEMLALPAMDQQSILDRIAITGAEPVRERIGKGLPTILVSGHFGNWEYLALASGLAIQHPIHMVVHPQSNAALDAELNSSREKFGNVVVPFHHAARTLVRVLKNGGVVAFLADQHARPDHDPWPVFFGRRTPTYEAPAALALRFNAPIYYAFAVRQPDGRYHAQIEELPVSATDTAETITQRHVHELEQAIIRHPHLWSWQHRRWRGQPPTLAHDGNRHAHTEEHHETANR